MLDFASIGDIYGEEEGEGPPLSETLKTIYYNAWSTFHLLIFNRQGSFFASVRLQRHELNNRWPPFKTVSLTK